MTVTRRTFLTGVGLTAASGAALAVVTGVRSGPASAAGSPAAVDATTAATSAVEVRAVGATRSTASFVDSLGINAHWSYLDTPYGTQYERVRDLLVASGIRHARTWETDRIADLAARGVRTTPLVDIGGTGPRDPAAQLQLLRAHARSGAVVAVEGPNEVDISWSDGTKAYLGQRFPQGPALWQRDLYRAVRADADLQRLTVIGMSLGGTYWGGGHPWAAGSMRDTCDWGNFHPYPGGNPYAPQQPYAGIARYYADSDFPSAALDRYPINVSTYAPPFGDRPMAATETGYSTWRWGQSERTQGLYLPRMFAENYRLGVRRTYAYELLDLFKDPSGEHRDHHFGLLRNDLTPKPAYRAVQSMVSAVVGDPDATADAGDGTGAGADSGATLTITPPDGYDPAALHHLALQRDDGSTVLLVWHEVSSNDQTGLEEVPKRPLRELSQPAVTVTVDLHRPAAGARATYLDDTGALRPKALSLAGSTVTLLVGDRLSFIELPAR